MFKAKNNYIKFINENINKKIVFLELGVGYSTPVWIKYPFIKMTYAHKNAKYICIDKGYIYLPEEIKKQSIILNDDINKYI